MAIHQITKDLFVRLAMPEDIPVVAAGIREADRREVWASHHQTPLEALETSTKRKGMCFTGVYKGFPIVIFGAARMSLVGGANPWLLGTEDIVKITVPFLRYSRSYIDLVRSEYRYLENYVDVRNELSIKWLKFCGFTFHAAAPYGVEQLPFYRFTMGG